ncbi:pectinesterase/pectinesterase inhibitor 21 [Spatholobus suberectus]|nr:pectinesterase/pectinesterase inhibitor 21 [Spatholobus suberectus]
MNYQRFASHHDKMDGDSKKKEGLILNIVIMVVSLIVIAMVTISVVANRDDQGTVKSLLSVCTKTEEPESCFRFLKHVGERATVLNYVKAAINATLTELLVVIRPKPRLEKSLTPLQRQSYIDCLELLSLGKEELKSLYVMANSYVELCKLNPDDVINGLSAVISYQHTCSDELMRRNSYEVLGYSLKVPILLTRITLAIVNNFCERPPRIDAQRLDGFPGWVSATGRRMIESQGDGSRQWPKNVVVAQDGSGHFSTIADSLNACPKNKSACIIYVKKGRYEERVVIPKDVNQVLMYGDGRANTIVNGINARDPKTVTTSFRAATFVVMGKGFICKDMGFTAPADITGAPALLVLSDHAAFFNCKIDGEEGSLFAVAQRQFYRDCEILGNVDIIKGDSATVIQNSQITVKTRNSSDLVLRRNVVSAQSRLDKYQTTGFVIQNCTITAHEESVKALTATTYLGSPYSEYSRTTIMESFQGDVIHPKGWCKWSDNYGIETATFREFNNRGPSARTDGRVRWYGYNTIFQRGQMVSYTAGRFIQADQWLPSTSIPYEPGFVVQK